MESNSIKEKLNNLKDTIRDLEFFQQLKTKWEEVDPQSRTYLKFAGIGGGVLLLLIFILSFVWSVHTLKTDYLAKQDLLREIQASNEEVRRIRDAMPNGALKTGVEAETGNWSPYFETIAANSGIDKTALTVSSEKPGTNGEQSKESLFDLSLKHINVKQIIKFTFNLENGTRPVKLRNLTVETKEDPSGYLNASLSVSAFTVVNQK